VAMHPADRDSVLLTLAFSVTCPLTRAQGTTSDQAASVVASAGNVSSPGVWTSVGPYGGRIRALAIDPTTPATLYAGTDGGGVSKSTDAGGTWAAANTGLEYPYPYVSALAIDPTRHPRCKRLLRAAGLNSRKRFLNDGLLVTAGLQGARCRQPVV
jgi:hypothetical protein